MSFFWYVSRSKLELLTEQYDKSVLDSFRGLALKFKTPVAEAELRFTNAGPGLVSEVRRVEKRIVQDTAPLDFECLSTEEAQLPPFFLFDTPAARLVEERGFWVAGHVGGAALVLVGAARHATGAFSSPSALSPSVDPLRAITEKAEGDSARVGADLGGASSYAWQAIMRTNGQNKIPLPTVRGIAVTVAVVEAQRQQIRRAGIPGIQRLVIGTPLHIEQT
ncbi:DUF7019 family protein [Streptomyces sp. NPDC005955]|uniref:DUF7019 family protein n=1 Tax=Streptomyces sp. NPDC005955 TaxID=3364738 RepID=UPI0036CDC9FD